MNEPSRPAERVGLDDIVLPYAVEPLSTRGRVARLGSALDALLKRHAYPEPVAKLVGEAVTLAVLLGSTLKIEGRFQLQTKTDGAVHMIIVDFDSPANIRALARYDDAKLARDASLSSSALLGVGHLAFTIDPGGEMSRYQGVIALEGQGFEAAAHSYFDRSEQIPTLVRLAVGQSLTPYGGQWRAGGLLAQFLPLSEQAKRKPDLDPGDAPEGAARDIVEEDDAWIEAKGHAATTEDHELLDPTLSSERLLFRLFNERGVRVFEPLTLNDVCRCSSEGIDAMLQSFPREERLAMVGDDGMIGVTCEFCSVKRVFDPKDYER